MDYNISEMIYLGCVKYEFSAEAIEYYFYDISLKQYFNYNRLSDTTCYMYESSPIYRWKYVYTIIDIFDNILENSNIDNNIIIGYDASCELIVLENIVMNKILNNI